MLDINKPHQIAEEMERNHMKDRITVVYLCHSNGDEERNNRDLELNENRGELNMAHESRTAV